MPGAGRASEVFRNIGVEGGKTPFASKINITSFITNDVLNILLFSNFFKKKKCNFLRKRQKIVSPAQVFFEGKEPSGDKNEYNLFYGKCGFEYFFI